MRRLLKGFFEIVTWRKNFDAQIQWLRRIWTLDTFTICDEVRHRMGNAGDFEPNLGCLSSSPVLSEHGQNYLQYAVQRGGRSFLLYAAKPIFKMRVFVLIQPFKLFERKKPWGGRHEKVLFPVSLIRADENFMRDPI
jgi:hypothetical protein